MPQVEVIAPVLERLLDESASAFSYQSQGVGRCTAIEELLGMPVFEVEADPPMRNTKIADADELRAVFYEAAERMPNPPE